MKNRLTLTLLTLIILLTVSCEKGEKPLTIGISKIVAHPALDAIEKGIMDTIKKEYPDVRFNLQNANGDMSTATQIANNFKMNKVDLAIGIATPTAMALVGSLEDIPVVYSAVTDPVSAGIVSSTSVGEEGVAGVSDMTPVESQIELLNKMSKITSLGHIYNSGEANGVALKNKAKQYCIDNNINFIEAVVTNTSEVKQAALSIINKVDGLYLSNDNTIFAALPAILEIANENKVPVMTADPESALNGGVFAAMGFNQYKLGIASAKVALEIINGTPTTDIPTVYLTKDEDLDLVINMDIARELEITIPENILNSATTILGE